MVINKTRITNISEFDSTLPENSIQKLEVTKDYVKPNTNITFINKLLERNVISNTKHKKVALMLKLDCDDFDTINNHTFIDYTVPLSTASYTYDPINKVCYVGLVSVQDDLRGRGIGTQMKKYLNNHMRQEKEDITAYTWISTDSGRKLADKTGFRSDKQIFEDINQIWSRTF